MKVTITKDISELEWQKGHVFEFPDNINIITGLNGIGKSSLLNAIRHYSDSDYYQANKFIENSVELDQEYEIFYYFAKEDNSQGVAMADMNLFLKLGGISRMRASSGENHLLAFGELVKRVRESKSTKPKLILLDEVDQSFDLGLQYRMLDVLKGLGNLAKVLYVTHNSVMIDTFGAMVMSKEGDMPKMTTSEILEHFHKTRVI